MYIDKQWFKDETGRTLILHGVNLGGSTKVPYAPDGATWRKEGFYDQQTDKNDLNSGGRGVKGFCRPYAMKTAGIPEKMGFNLKKRIFHYTFLPDPALAVPTEIFVPSVHYPDGYLVELSAGRYEKDEKNSILRIFSSADAGNTSIRIKVLPAK